MTDGILNAQRQRLTALYQAWPRTTIIVGVGLLIAGIVVLNLLFLAIGRPSALPVLSEWALAPTTAKGDSWDVMHVAREWLTTNASAPGFYDAIFFEQQLKFQYAPTSLLVLDAFSAIGVTPDNDLLNTINRICIALTAAGCGWLAWLMMRRDPSADTPDKRLAARLAAPVAIALTLIFYPVLRAYELGQLQVWINLLFVGAVIAWLTDRRSAAGVLIGLICLLKPQFGLFLVWGLIRREWRFAAALAITGAAGLLISVVLYGFENHLGYLKVLSFLSQHGESFWANQSVNGIVHRLVGANGGEFDANGFPPANTLVYALTLITSVAIMAFALVLRRGQGEAARLTDFLLAAIAFTAASPIAWEHHYGVLAPAFVALALILANTPPARMQLWLIAGFTASYFFAASFLPYFRDATGALTLVQSYLFYAALGVLAMLRFHATRRTPVTAYENAAP